MGEDEKGIESPFELLGQLIEESGKWVEEIVALSRKLIIVWIFAIFQIIIVICLCIFYLIPREPIPLPYLLFIVLCAILLIINLGNVLFRLRRNFKNRVFRRDQWKEKIGILKKREEEIEKLLSEG